MIFLGGFRVDSKVFLFPLIATYSIIVMILSGAVVHVFDGWQHSFFHKYSIIEGDYKKDHLRDIRSSKLILFKVRSIESNNDMK